MLPGLSSGGGVLVLPAVGRRLGGAATVQVAQVRLQVGPQPGAVLALEGPELLDLALEAGALLLQRAHDLVVSPLGVLVECGGLGARLALHRLRAGPGGPPPPGGGGVGPRN